MLTAWVVAAIWALAPQTGAPSQCAAVRGVVVDAKTGIPLNDAHVEIVELHLDVQTNAAGRFEFPRVTPGPFTLTISTVGYIFVRRRLDLHS